MNQTEEISLSVVRDFSRTPGARSSDEGQHSGEKFLKEVLRPRFQEAVSNRVRLHVDLDGVAGYATSFLEAAFGGLAREFGSDAILPLLVLKSEDEPYLIVEIKEYIREARRE